MVVDGSLVFHKCHFSSKYLVGTRVYYYFFVLPLTILANLVMWGLISNRMAIWSKLNTIGGGRAAMIFMVLLVGRFLLFFLVMLIFFLSAINISLIVVTRLFSHDFKLCFILLTSFSFALSCRHTEHELFSCQSSP